MGHEEWINLATMRVGCLPQSLVTTIEHPPFSYLIPMLKDKCIKFNLILSVFFH